MEKKKDVGAERILTLQNTVRTAAPFRDPPKGTNLEPSLTDSIR